ncbi:MAG: hypothetical protein IPM77_01160 [Crocinitomicaceae bacterium]|nr:hypothetical protein [Crocinitomicaceae bacterium]
MAKGITQRAAVPAHIFESMLRSAMNSEGDLSVWKDELLHWDYTAAQLDQFESALKEGAKQKSFATNAKEAIEFIETKIRNRKD